MTAQMVDTVVQTRAWDGSRVSSLYSIPIVVNDALRPTHVEDARRIVRHGMKDVLEWLGEKVGPKPGEGEVLFAPGGGLMMTTETFERFKGAAA